MQWHIEWHRSSARPGRHEAPGKDRSRRQVESRSVSNLVRVPLLVAAKSLFAKTTDNRPGRHEARGKDRSRRQVEGRSVSARVRVAILVALVSLLSFTAGGTLRAPTAGSCRLTEKLVPSCGALWGAYVSSGAGQDWTSPFTDVERSVGRRFDIVKRYHDWSNAGEDGQFPDSAEQTLGARGARILFFAWTSGIYSTGSHVMWRDIARGVYDDSVIVPEARRILSWRLPVFLDFDHEMEGQDRRKDGSPAEYIAAYQHIHDVFDSQGVTNVIWVWTSTGWLANVDRIAASYPGDAYVDWIGYDPYNFYTCNGSAWKTPTQTVEPFYDWLIHSGHRNKPFMLAEYGSVTKDGDSNALGMWYGAMAGTLANFPNLKAVVQFDSATSSACDFRVTTSASALAGFARSALSPYVNVR
jgi:Glycosyl hydrolase family 26